MKRPALIGAIIAAAVFAGFLLYEQPALSGALVGLKLVPLPEPITELYFNDIGTLPVRNTGTVKFSFTIHNLEGTDMVYPYTVSAQFADGTTAVLDQNTIPIASGDSAKVPETLIFKSIGTTSIAVTLPSQNEHIQFLLR